MGGGGGRERITTIDYLGGLEEQEMGERESQGLATLVGWIT